jgi:transposase
MKVTTVGVDLAKNLFQVHGVDERGQVALRKKLKREQMLEFFVRLPACLVGMEACGGAHFWASKLIAMGHTVKLMAPQFVKPYVKTNKNDARDAEAICEAVARPNMRFVPVKSPEQQAVLSMHRVRQGFVKTRTAQANQIRGLLAEFGLVIPMGITKVRKCLAQFLGDEANGLPPPMRTLLQRQLEELAHLDKQVDELTNQITNWHRLSETSRRLAEIPGIGPLSATAMLASMGSASHFHDGRHLSAWIGIVPRQHSSGGKAVMLGISKHGDTYLRTLLIHGARAVVSSAKRKPPLEQAKTWLGQLTARRNANVAAVALANKNARIAWALLAHDRRYDPGHRPKAPSAAAATVAA